MRASHFKFSVASCDKTTAYFIIKDLELIEHHITVLLTNFEASSSIIKGIFGHFYL